MLLAICIIMSCFHVAVGNSTASAIFFVAGLYFGFEEKSNG